MLRLRMIRYMKKLIQLITVAMGVFMILKGANAEEGSTQIFFKDVHAEQPKRESAVENPKVMKLGSYELTF